MHAQTKTHDPRSIRSLTPSPRRLSDTLADPATLTTLQVRLARHGAELSDQLQELLLLVPDPQEAVGSWLADKDLSHWIPQSEGGGGAAQGWQLETASWNRGAMGAGSQASIENLVFRMKTVSRSARSPHNSSST